jgi:hypothetical protein
MARRCKRNYKSGAGWVEAAKAIGCTASHLRRVIIGERRSKSLKRKFRAWRRAQHPPRTGNNSHSAPATPESAHA